jgi:hypothetical protein
VTLSTEHPLTVETLGRLVVEARKNEIRPTLDEKGRPFYTLTWDGKSLKIASAKIEVDKKSVGTELWKLVDKAIALGVKPRVDANGQKFLTLAIDRASKQAWIEPSTAEDLKRAKAITPGKR